MSTTPQNFQYGISSGLSWDAVEGALQYEIFIAPEDTDDWDSQLTIGSETTMVITKPSGKHKVKGKAKNMGGWGLVGDVEEIEIP